MERPTGIRVRHTGGLTNALYVVEVPSIPYTDGGFLCGRCQAEGRGVVHHRNKAIHLWLEPDGGCLVSTGVYATLQKAGMPNLATAGVTHTPPPLAVGRNVPLLEAQHNHNRRIDIPQYVPELSEAT